MSDSTPGPRRDVSARKATCVRNVAAALVRAGIRPNTVSVCSVVFACGSGLCMLASVTANVPGAIALLLAALALLGLRVLCNLFDGLMAIEFGAESTAGEVFNDLPDRLADPIFLVCAGHAARGVPFAPGLGWLAGLLAVLTAYVRVLGGAAGAGQFFLGPMAKQHRIAVLSVGLLAAAVARPWDWDGRVLSGALGLIVAGCVVTIVRRAVRIVRELGQT